MSDGQTVQRPPDFGPIWADAREVERLRLLSYGWTALDAAWTAYYGKPFSAVLVRRDAR